MDPVSSESAEARTVRYLTWAEEAMRSANMARSQDLRNAHLDIARSWMRMAEEAMRRIGRA